MFLWMDPLSVWPALGWSLDAIKNNKIKRGHEVRRNWGWVALRNWRDRIMDGNDQNIVVNKKNFHFSSTK